MPADGVWARAGRTVGASRIERVIIATGSPTEPARKKKGMNILLEHR